MMKETAENYRNCYVAEKRIVSKLSGISISNFYNTNLKLESKLCQIFTSLFLTLSEKIALKERHGRVRPGRVEPVHCFK